jgi:hypothetical protein
MAWSSAVDGLLLDTWRRNVREDVWLFNQIKGKSVIRDRPVYVQKDRDAIGIGIRQAYDMMRQTMRFSLTPAWFVEDVPLPYGEPINGQYVRLGHGHIQALGKYATSLIEANVSVAYSDPDNDTINELATISVSTDVDADEIAVFFRVADGAYSAGNVKYRIMPVQVSSNGATATVTAHRANFVKPSVSDVQYDMPEQDSNNRNIVNPAVATEFVTAVDVYRVYTDSSSAVQLIGCEDCTNTLYTVNARIVDAVNGLIELCSDADCTGYPDHVRVSYYAGYKLAVDGSVYPSLATALTRLANTLISEQPDGLQNPITTSYIADNEDVSGVGDENHMKFGMKAGQVAAAKLASMWQMPRCDKYGVHRVRYQDETL